ncbi:MULTISPECIES: hypothetical protein [unclassified Helicobacter]|uniref:hypothetical protein n=1 Tax=unclassified Helicobacter TaxID=2593540 RepID=UPI000CF1AA87|nr:MULTISPECIES: hypothetical protein [unclassified Helicobacter]
MKKVLFTFFSFTFLLLLAGYSVLFTKGGNNILKPFIRDTIKEKYNKDLYLVDFQLTPKTLHLTLEYGKNLDLKVFGDLTLWNQKLDLRVFGKSKGIKNAFNIEGEVVGDFSNFLLNLMSNIASSKSNLVAEFGREGLSRLYLKSKNLNLEDVFLFFHLDHRLIGRADLEINLDKRIGNRGDFEIDLTKLSMTKNFGSSVLFNRLLKSEASGKIKGKLNDKNLFILDGGLESKLYKITLSEAQLGRDMFSGKYNLLIPSIKNAGVVSRRDIPLEFEGDIVFNDELMFDFQTGSLGGNITGKYEIEKTNIVFKDIELDSIFPILGIPQNFLGRFTGDFNYEVQKKQGVLEGNIEDFSIRRDSFFDLIYRYTKFDIQKEKFNTIPIYATLEGQKLDIHNFGARSHYIGMSSSNISLDFQKMVIRAPIRVNIQDSSINLRVVGDIKSPQVDFKLGDVLKLNKKLF